VLEAVPDDPEPEEGAAVHALHLERNDEADLAAELMEQVERWQRLADELREERDAVQHHLASRDRSLAAAYAQIEAAAERLAASERARTEAEETAAELGETRHLLEVERTQREQVEDAATALHAELEASDVALRLAREELEEARREPEPVLATEHVVFARTGARYALVAAEGPPPEPGARLELDERDYVVLKVGRSPFPGDDRPCAFAEPA
jgi:DNA repair exonuclease SbcCD ATPase subunit